jgi:hypothetical protein
VVATTAAMPSSTSGITASRGIGVFARGINDAF